MGKDAVEAHVPAHSHHHGVVCHGREGLPQKGGSPWVLHYLIEGDISVSQVHKRHSLFVRRLASRRLFYHYMMRKPLLTGNFQELFTVYSYILKERLKNKTLYS